MNPNMMMSQRPSASSNNAASRPAPTQSSSSTIGKYKGVMLCNRPHRGPAQAGNTANKALSTGGVQPFRAGGHNPIQNDIGLTRARPVRHAAPRKKVPSVTSKHKEWLKNYTAKKLRAESEMEKQEVEKAKKTDAFMKRERKLRNAILSNVKQDQDNESPEEPQTSARKPRSRDEELEELLRFTQDINEEEFDKQMDEMLENDDDADWVGSLLEKELTEQEPVEFDPESDDNELVHPDTGKGGYDGDDAISRREWRQRMVETVDPVTGEASDADDAISRRDYLTEQGVDVERVSAGDVRNRALPQSAVAAALTADALAEWKSKNGDNNATAKTAAPEEEDVLSTASAVLADSKKIRSVHSARSVAAVARQKANNKLKLPEIKEIPAPRIVTLDEQRLEYKKHPNQLPYMNRNPAV